MKTKIISFIFYYCFISISVSPGKSEVRMPTHANWVISFDMKAFHNSRMGKFIMEKIKNAPNINQKMEGLKNAFGVDFKEMREI